MSTNIEQINILDDEALAALSTEERNAVLDDFAARMGEEAIPRMPIKPTKQHCWTCGGTGGVDAEGGTPDEPFRDTCPTCDGEGRL